MNIVQAPVPTIPGITAILKLQERMQQDRLRMATLLKQAVADAEFTGATILRVWDNGLEQKDAPLGTRWHLIRSFSETGYDRIMGHPDSACDSRWCQKGPGSTQKHRYSRTPNRHWFTRYVDHLLLGRETSYSADLLTNVVDLVFVRIDERLAA